MRETSKQQHRMVPVAALCAAALLTAACGDRNSNMGTRDREGPATTTERTPSQRNQQERPVQRQPLPSTGDPQRQPPAQPGLEPAPSGGTSGKASTSASGATEFVRNAASGGMYEVESSKLALKEEIDARTKEFARRMIEDHEDANAKLKRVAGEEGVQVPEAMLPPQQKMLEALQSAQGQQFALVYRQQQLQAHQQAVQLFEKAEQELGASPLGKFASETLPILREHLQHVKTLAGSGANAPGDTTGGTDTGSATGASKGGSGTGGSGTGGSGTGGSGTGGSGTGGGTGGTGGNGSGGTGTGSSGGGSGDGDRR